MRKTPWEAAEKYRRWDAPGGMISRYGDDFGVFQVPSPVSSNILLRIIATSGVDMQPVWEHVSVSLPNRCPNWAEMCFVKDLFWEETECAMQLHVPKSEHINCHEYCLHLWKPVRVEIPVPPGILVGLLEVKTA